MSDETGVSTLAAELARAFDRGFAEPIAGDDQAREDFLALRAGGHPFAIRLRDVHGVVADRQIVPLPTRAPALLGLAGLRGGLVAVYGLDALLGGAPPVESPRWVALVGTRQAPWGLAFEALDGHVRLPRAGRDDAGVAPASIPFGDGWRPVLDLAALGQRIGSRGGAGGAGGSGPTTPTGFRRQER